MFHFKLTNRRFRVGEVLSKRLQLQDAHLTNARSIISKGYNPQYRSSI